MAIMIAVVFFQNFPVVPVLVGLVGNATLLVLMLNMRLVSLRWVKWIKVCIFLSSAWNAGCAVLAQLHPNSALPTVLMASGFAVVWFVALPLYGLQRRISA